MNSRRSWLLLTIAAVLGVAGCAAVDDFASRSTQFNIEAEQTQNQVLLLNVIRASKRRARAFTALQTVTGTASATGGLSLSLPFGRNNGPNNLGLTSGMSGGPTFAVSVLDSQEFYQGIMKPIPMPTIDFYVQQRYPRSLLFNLFLSSIVIRQEGTSVDIANYPGTNDDLDRFQLAVDYLINLGLTTETVKSSASGFGPVRTAKEVLSLADVARAAAAGLDVETVGWCSLKADGWRAVLERLNLKTAHDPKEDIDAIVKTCDDKKEITFDDLRGRIPRLPRALYRAQKPGAGAKVQFCFGAPLASTSEGDTLNYFTQSAEALPFATFLQGLAASKSACAANKIKKPNRDAVPRGQLDLFDETVAGNRTDEGFAGFGIPSKLLAKLSAGTGLEIDATKPVSIEFVPRSTEAVIYYLGEVARRWNDPDLDPKRVVSFHYGPPRKEIPLSPCTGPGTVDEGTKFKCEALFFVEEGGMRDAFVSVDYDGSRYAIPDDPQKAGRSSSALNILIQLIALNRSAKDAPASTVFNVINP